MVPMFVEGVMDVMHEERTFPRFLPRLGRDVDVTFGREVPDSKWAGFRERWRGLRVKAGMSWHGDELNEELMHGDEAQGLRIEVAKILRDEVEKLRMRRGYPEEDPKATLRDTWIEEGSLGPGRKKDDSVVGRT